MAETTWRELAPGVYVRRHEELELNCGLVVGEERALVIDTRSTTERGHELAAAVREVTDLEQVVVNTHAHYDHCFGNAAFRDSQIYAHADALEDLRTTAEHQREQVVAHLRRTDREALAQTYVDTEVVLPFYLIVDDTELDLGGRTVHLHHGGRAHTNHDLVVSVPDAGVVFWADLVEQGADPAMEDAYPLEWAETLAELRRRPAIAEATIHVPGHGDVVDTAYVDAQMAALEALAAVLAESLAARVREVDALVAKAKGLGLQDTTLRDAAVRALETGTRTG
jgi:glyoxylase-like metal-dependent hydrolase (beta-lactamase superfamily II)